MSKTTAAAPSELIGSIYEAALEPGKWQGVVAHLTTWIGGITGALQIRRLQPPGSLMLVSSGLDPAFERAYREHYHECDPHLARVAQLARGQTLLSREVLADEELFATPFFNEFCRPQELCDVQGAVLLRDDALVATFASYCSDGRRFDERTRARLDALVPHLTRALNLARSREALALTHAAWSAAAGARRAGLLRVNATLQVLDASPGASLWLAEEGLPLVLRDGHLKLRERRDEQALRAAVQSACCGGPFPRELIAHGDPPVTLVICPEPVALTESEPAALLLFSLGTGPARSKASFETKLPPSLLPVARAIAAGLSDKEIASQLDLEISTARTYVTRVFRRLGVHGRRELLVRYGR